MEMKTADAYGLALELAAEKNENIVVLDADLAACMNTTGFAEKFPNRYYNVGIAESNMIGIAAGFATTGKMVFAGSFAMFTAGRAYDQVRNSIAYPKLNVKVLGSYAGLSNGEDGASHQCFEDLALMRAVPNMVVINPCDAYETKKMMEAIMQYEGPCYIRMGRGPVETVTDVEGYKFEIGKGVTFKEGKDVTIIAIGNMVQVALKAEKILQEKGISATVIDMHTIKPIDKELILESAKKTGAIVTTEEHNILGGLGSAVSEVITNNYPIPVVHHGMKDTFGKSGKSELLMKKFGLSPEGIVEAVEKAISLKSK